MIVIVGASTSLSLKKRRDDAHRDFDSAQSDDEKDQFNLKSTPLDDKKTMEFRNFIYINSEFENKKINQNI
jgi:hypothetical protein